MFSLNKPKLRSIIQNLSKGSVLVIGDFAIDEMIYGQTHRISREAPVLILKHSYTKIILGGASNAAHNIARLNNGKVSTIGVYGEDYYGPVLLNTLNEAGINTSNMIMDKDRVTSVKTRISGSSAQSVTQQIVRLDREVNEFINSNIESKIIDNIRKTASTFDAILLSDYGIGMMTPDVIKETTKIAKQNGVFLAVDAQDDLSRFKGVNVMTPNQPEAERTLGYELKDRATLLKGGQELLDKTQAEMILITRGSEGMVLFEKNGKISDIPVFNKTEVFDVTGAGDTVVGTFILGACAEAEYADCAVLGNLAASIVVRHFGCATTSVEELQTNLEKLNEKTLEITV